MIQPLISVIIPTFNQQKFIAEAIESVIHQNYANWELIIIDDGSSDRTLEIIETYGRKENRIKIIQQENRGPSAARNKGIHHATGDYYFFLDGDDVLYTDALEHLASHSSEQILIGCWDNIDEVGNLLDQQTNQMYTKINDPIAFTILRLPVISCILYPKSPVLWDEDLWLWEGIDYMINQILDQSLPPVIRQFPIVRVRQHDTASRISNSLPHFDPWMNAQQFILFRKRMENSLQDHHLLRATWDKHLLDRTKSLIFQEKREQAKLVLREIDLSNLLKYYPDENNSFEKTVSYFGKQWGPEIYYFLLKIKQHFSFWSLATK